MSVISQTDRIAYRFPSLAGYPVRHAMSGRLPGERSEGDVGHGPNTNEDEIEHNRAAFIEAAGMSMADLVISRQTHGTEVAVVSRADRGRGLYPAFDGFPATDAMVTNEPTVALGTIVADCVPILLYDPVQHAIGLAHAGWRGTVGQIAAATVATMVEVFGTDPADLFAGIGPSIGPCCYEVGSEVIDAWAEADVTGQEAAVHDRETGYHFNLWAANRLVLIQAGLAGDRIESSNVCVRCEHERYFSYRATRQIGAHPGRNLLVAQLLPV
jgi:YfiH family protein